MEHGPCSSGFRVTGAVYQARQASVNHSAGAHGARFNCNKDVASPQAVVSQPCGSLAQSDNLRVGRGIMVEQITVVSTSGDLAIFDY